ncbi:ABC transporter substrate-binding protein [Kamptonema sp. UHCC 0994]|uniref:ABC transporter substrate-binding protein n=1 Tax=Kamptonema sp. UHCC 0994 TaxID=3031329 RepID=UPI0023B9A521|nr:ABC transporter substrate-binding protein [Kamptonema sp. UHCC 0994]MDF0555364.1 ABC transporter substrate-binding protein [Kamptonema sp. UHCC 0994]
MVNSKPLAQFLRSITPKLKIRKIFFVHLSLVWRRTGLYLLALFTSIILGILFFFIQPALTQQPIVLTMLMQGQDLLNWRPFVEEFEQKNPDIRINLVEGPFDSNLIENLYTSAFLLGDSPYDIINMDIVWVPKFAAAGWIMDLSNKISSEQLSKFIPGNVEGGRYKGKLYRIPHASDAGMLYYRKDILEQAGVEPPETFEQMVNISQNLQKQGKATWGYLWQGKQYEGVSAMFVEVLEGFGGFWANPQTFEIGLDKPEAIKAVEFLKSTITSGISPPGVTTYGEEETRLLFQSGKTIFLRNWPYVWKLANVEGSKIKGKIAIKPMLHAAGKKGGSCLGGWGWGIAKTSRHPEEAWRAIQYLTSEETQRKFILQTGFVPSYKSLFTDRQVVALYPHYPQLLKVVEQAALRPPLAQYAQASDILQRYLSAAFTGRMTSEKAMKAAASETRNLLGRFKPSQANG